MIKSMTGFGRAQQTKDNVSLTVEVKTLNSKFMDLTLRLPRPLNDKELEIRTWINDLLERGKVSLAIELEQTGKTEVQQTYNEELFKAYYRQLEKLAASVNETEAPLFQLALAAPEVVKNQGKEELPPQQWAWVGQCIQEALRQCDRFREEEGNVLSGKLRHYVATLRQALAEVETLDPQRIARVRTKIKGSVTEFFGSEGYDLNRLEQEIIYYIEKLDIHEERVRLRAHLDHFEKTLGEKQSNGKKLGFLSQEMGREINTIGSKANDADIQKHVVSMKEELEKIKEQLNNVL
ncbi:MAG: YicC family protein [Cyclobacteriaceae bacterium]|jgi:uncharacterized protein (TIGR00255 family)|nr:YicC family protein [Cyclobacteriaceae bacterium]